MELYDIGRYTVYYEYESAVGGAHYSTNPQIPEDLRFTLDLKLSRQPVKVVSLEDGRSRYSFGSRKGVSAFQFTIDEPGIYEYKSFYERPRLEGDIVLAIEHGFGGRMFKFILTILLWGYIITATVVIGLVLGVLFFFKDRAVQPRGKSDKKFVYDVPPTSTIPKEERMFAAFCHISSFALLCGIPLGNILGPLIFWAVKKSEFAYVNRQGKESLNFQISMTLYAIIAGILAFVIIGIFFLLIVMIVDIIWVIIAAIKTNQGENFRYPLSIRFIR